jgi:hypothetical protein
MVAGAAFKVKHAGKEGHFHVTQDHGDEVTVRHDESGHEQKMSKAALRAMLHAEHAEALGAVKARALKVLEQAKKTGTAKQQEKAAAMAGKYAKPDEIKPNREVDRQALVDLMDKINRRHQIKFDLTERTSRPGRSGVMPENPYKGHPLDSLYKDFLSYESGTFDLAQQFRSLTGYSVNNPKAKELLAHMDIPAPHRI